MKHSARLLLARAAAMAAVACAASSCVPEPAPGEYGLFRYVGNVRGATPLSLFPPISDREGNAYVLYGGGTTLNESKLFIGHYEGGWRGDCDFVQVSLDTNFENNSPHGFVGRTERKAWFWMGQALFRANGRTGDCDRILTTDPSSGAPLNFRAIIPWVRDTPSRTTTLAWIQASSDPRPFRAVIDLDNNVYTDLDEFAPADAEDVTILGVGGNVELGEGVLLVRYTSGGNVHTEARFIRHDGSEIDIASVSGLEALPAYTITGYLQSNDSGLYAGLDSEGMMVVLDHSGGQRKGVSGMTPIGIHRWDGQLYLVGEGNGRPLIASIDDDGDIGKVQTWDASAEAQDKLGSKIDVIDDRTLPSTQTVWRNPRSAVGTFPFLHAHSLDLHASETTSWLIAGPTFTAQSEEHTAIAFVPVGIAYEE